MLPVLAIATCLAAPSTFETYVVTLDYDGPVRLVVNGMRVEEPISKRVVIEHYVVPGKNDIFIEPLQGKPPASAKMGQLRLVLGRTDSRSWQESPGQVIAELKSGVRVFTVPQTLREPLWRMGPTLGYEAEVTYRAKIEELHALLVAKNVEGFLDQLAESYAETERLFPMVDVAALRRRDADALRALLAKGAVGPLPVAPRWMFNLEGSGHVMVAMHKGTRQTFEIGDAPLLIGLIKVNGALRPYRAIRP